MEITLFDPLFHYSYKVGYNPELIERIVTGEKYTAVLLKNGNIGTCANLNSKITLGSAILQQIDINSDPDRIIYTAILKPNFLKNIKL